MQLTKSMSHLTNILGVETTRDIAEMVWAIMGQTWQRSFTTRDMRILSVALTTTLVVVVVQLYVSLTNSRKKLGWVNLFGAIIFDVIVFTFLVIGQVKFAYWMLDVKAPRAIVIERVSPELVSVNWKTYDPEYSMVLFGYEADRLHEVELGVGENIKDRRHEVLIETEPGRDVYIKIIVGEEVYGRNNIRSGEPYGVKGGM